MWASRFADLHHGGKTDGFFAPPLFAFFMKFSPLLPALWVCAMMVSAVQAQDAQAIIDSSAKLYGGMQTFSAQVESRTINLILPPQPPEGAPLRYDVRGTTYRRLQIRVRRSTGAYWLASQIYQDGGVPVGVEMSGADPHNPSARPGANTGMWALLGRNGDGTLKQGTYVGTRFLVQDMPAGQFDSVAAARTGARGNNDFVLRHFPADGATPEGNLALGLVEPEVLGRESLSGFPAHRISAKTSDGAPVLLWVDTRSSLVLRSIVQRSRVMTRPGSAPSAATSATSITITDTFYNHQRIDPPLSTSDFIVTTPLPNERLTADQIGFSSVAELVKAAEISVPGGEAPVVVAAADSEVTPPAAQTPVDSATTPEITGQALSYEQMSGLVLIDGDGGTATGFMTKIRDVDFVVTNLHVLVGSRKFSIKTLRGEEIAVQGIFGAVGGDIAIIRIPKGEGDLRLATDVFQTSKIGDKVVVVGNRRGGGVATQTSGRIKGIGPNLVEVDANFQSGNSGSPIVNLNTNEVVGVATYSETRRVEIESGAARAPGTAGTSVPQVEKRWFGYRLDSVSKWEGIDLGRWNDQGERIDKFRETSEALVAVIKFDFSKARQNPRLTSIIQNFETRYRIAGGNSMTAATEVKDLFRVIRTISEDGVRDLTHGDYYDYYRTCQYWEHSIPSQLDYRKRIVEVLKKYEANSSLYLSRLRSGN